jgi:hypothetical protein
MNWQIDNIKGLCELDQPQKFSCLSSVHTLFTSSILWGTLGPERMYGSKGIYNATLYGFLIGAFLPIPIYLLAKWKYPRLRHVYASSYLMGGICWAPHNLTHIFPALWIGYLFNVIIKKRYLQWWGSFNVRSPISSSLLTVLKVPHVICFDARLCFLCYSYFFWSKLLGYRVGLVGKQ